MTPRKRAKPNPVAEASTTSLPATLLSRTGSVASQVNNTPSSSSSAASTVAGQGMPPTKRDGSDQSTTANANNTNKVRRSRSWYGSWPRIPKSSPSTQVSHQTIMGSPLRAGATPDFSRYDSKKADSSGESDTQSIKTIPKIAGSDIQPKQDDGKPITKPQEEDKAKPGDGNISSNAPKDNNDAVAKDSRQLVSSDTADQPQASSGWLGWVWGSSTPQNVESKGGNPEAVSPESQETTMPDAPPQPPVETEQAPSPQPPPPPPPSETPKAVQPSTSWFGFWYSTPTPALPDTTAQTTAGKPSAEQPVDKEPRDVVMQDAPSSTSAEATQPSAGSTWAFWSRDTGNNNTSGKTTAASAQGELAVIGDGSEASPRRSTGFEVDERTGPSKEPPIKAPKEQPAKTGLSRRSKRVRPHSMDIDESSSRPGTPQSDTSAKTAPSKPTTLTPSKTTQNLLLPSFRDTYHMKNNPSIIKQIAQLLLRTQEPPANHVFLTKEPPKIRKAIAIGIHGLFPASFLRPMIGQPTGTSIRFANHCAEAIRRWAESHGCGDCEIEKVALEGEGKIADRVDNLWKLLLNWIEHIRSADLIVLACHSQGVPVGLMLLAKLIDLRIITHARVGVCAMAGVSLGPFPDYKSGMGMLMGSAAELWQFADPESDISQRHKHALEVAVNYGARITYIGSIDDQLVPMESTVYSPAIHPYIYRAVFIDGRIHAPDFIAHLVGFALKLRNLGISDHGLIRELSVPLAGSLYSGEGHSRLYDDEQVYDLAISHALETTSVSGVPCRIQKHEGLTNPNPYVLPWIMRGLLEEDFVKTELFSETVELLRQFDSWSPTTKALKDVKYRLEAVRSKL
ncbi:hypothetical protein F5B20DRAFT_533026 [Whalleya microplaca]|nr:hypothetical protein F5B20DRAFT_533026 [Whalleya microplaca]